MAFTKNIQLPTGSLNVHINEPEELFNHYIDFAARNNPKRGFLFVSKVLGKHYPCKPSIMQDSYNQLVDLLRAEEKDSQSFVFVGMAETATALGAGVYESWLQRSDKNGIYCQTTRYFLKDQPFVDFQEAHTHAKDFYLYIPENENLKQHFHNADTLVLIDDEISTGNTFANLVNAYKKLNPNLKRVIVVSLLNLTNETARERVEQQTGIAFEWLSVLSGGFEFTPNPDFEFKLKPADSNAECKKHLLPANYGRLGINELLPSLTEAMEELTTDYRPQAKILVLGTGEFIYHAFLLGRELENNGFEAYVQSTSRSPILEGYAISQKLEFQDNYHDGISNYLYNHDMLPYEHVIVVHETPQNAELDQLSTLLNATAIKINHGTVCIS